MPNPTTAILALTPPTIGGDPGPIWPQELNNNLAIIDKAMAAAVNNTSISASLVFGPSWLTVWRCSPGASTITATLPTPNAANAGRIILCSKVDGVAGGVVQIIGTINGVSNYDLVNQGQVLAIMSNGSTWDIAWNN